MKTVCDRNIDFIEEPAAVALGNFDGVHLGHRYLLEQMLKTAAVRSLLPVVCTFAPHPEKYYNIKISMISTVRQKMALLEDIGVEVCFQAVFDSVFANLSPENFMAEYIEKRLNAKAVIAGDDFRFGKDRLGDIKLLEGFCEKRGIALFAVPRLETGGNPISSTIIREAAAAGDMEKIPKYLGRHLSCAGTVVYGDKTGQKLGFPTANIELESELTPPDGAYAGYIDIDNIRRTVMLYIGKRPTVANNGTRRFEFHIIDWRGDLYGKYLEVFIAKKIRDDCRFNSADELRAQLERDKTLALGLHY